MDWSNEIKNSKIFCAFIDNEGYFDNAICYCQKEIAKDMNKPFFVIIKRGIMIPDDYFDGIDDIEVIKFDSEDELNFICKAIKEKVFKEEQ